ncbi:MAG: hypothetical protein Q4C49_00610 [Bacillota bacterium]|nr:hypothetical protein [Bacillota bacterium]
MTEYSFTKDSAENLFGQWTSSDLAGNAILGIYDERHTSNFLNFFDQVFIPYM